SLAATLSSDAEGDEPHALVLDLHGQRRAFSLERVIGEQELVRRPADHLVRSLGYVAASAVLDDGQLVLLLRPESLLGRAGAHRSRPAAAPVDRRQRRVLVVDDSFIVRELLADMLHGVGLDVAMAEDGAAALRSLE